MAAAQLLTRKDLQEHVEPVLIFSLLSEGCEEESPHPGLCSHPKVVQAGGQHFAVPPNLSPLTTFDYLKFLEIEAFKTWYFEKQNILRISFQCLSCSVVSTLCVLLFNLCFLPGPCLTQTTAACFSDNSNLNQTQLLSFLACFSGKKK